jgi:hypothetical protein
MSKWTTSLAPIGFLALSIGVAATHAQPLSQALDVSVAAEMCQNEPLLVFTITNVSGEPITLPNSEVPWNHHYSVTLVVVPRNQDPLPAISPIADEFGLATTTLQPGEKLVGEVRISRYVKRLGEVLQERDVIVFWYYEPMTDTARALGEFGGWVKIARPEPT